MQGLLLICTTSMLEDCGVISAANPSLDFRLRLNIGNRIVLKRQQKAHHPCIVPLSWLGCDKLDKHHSSLSPASPHALGHISGLDQR